MDRRFKVVITDFISGSLDPERTILDSVATVKALEASTEEDLIGRIEDADAVMMYHYLPTLSRRTIERLERCRLIVRCGVGYENIDYRTAADHGIPVANVPDYGTEDVADSAIGMMLSLTRGIAYLNMRLRHGQGEWSYLQAAPLHRLRGQVLGIVGLGRIGTAVAVRAKAFGMDVIYYDPYKESGYDKALGIARAESLDVLLKRSRVVTLHCPLTDGTRHMIDAEQIGKMLRGSYLINTARGGVVSTAAVADALASGQLAGAGIDVLDQEPPRKDNPIICAWRDPQHAAHDRLIINPHSAFYTEEGLADMRVRGAEACLAALTGQPIPNQIHGPVAEQRTITAKS